MVHEEDSDAEVRNTHADVLKKGDLIGYEPSVEIHQGLEVHWLASREQEWYEPLIRN